MSGDPPSKNQRKRRSKKKKDVVYLAFDDQNPEIRGIGNLIYGTGWMAGFIFVVGLFSFFVMAAESSSSGPLPPGPTPPPTAPPMQAPMAAYMESTGRTRASPTLAATCPTRG